jgi:hypothetical protein
VEFIDMRDARREIERDERRIDLEMRKDGIVDRNSREGIDMMVNAPTRRTDYVPCEIRHFVGKVRIQGLHVGKIRREGFLSLDHVEEILIKIFQPETY